MDVFVVYLLLNAVLAAPVAYVASQKGRSPLGFYALSFFFSFLVGILVVLALPKQSIRSSADYFTGKVTQTSDGDELAKCPFCAEWVKSEAIRCRYCGEDIGYALADIKAAEAKAREDAATAAALEKETAAQLAEENKDKRTKAIVLTSLGAGVGVAVIVAASIYISTEQKKAEAVKVLEIAQTECPIFEELANKLDIQLDAAVSNAYMGDWPEASANISEVGVLRARIFEDASRLPGVGFSTDSFISAVSDYELRVSGYINARAKGVDPFITSYQGTFSHSRTKVLDYCSNQAANQTPTP